MHRSFPLLFLAALSTPAWATSTTCVFHSMRGTPDYDIEFTGYDRAGLILISPPGGPRSLPAGPYERVEFDQRTSKVHLV